MVDWLVDWWVDWWDGWMGGKGGMGRGKVAGSNTTPGKPWDGDGSTCAPPAAAPFVGAVRRVVRVFVMFNACWLIELIAYQDPATSSRTGGGLAWVYTVWPVASSVTKTVERTVAMACLVTDCLLAFGVLAKSRQFSVAVMPDTLHFLMMSVV